MEPMAPTERETTPSPPNDLQFRLGVMSMNGDALEKMGVVDPEDKTLWRKLFDLFL